jgi:NAD(P)-dependent dehydrogenase (short-subunit alcohol dehydrogenase family)
VLALGPRLRGGEQRVWERQTMISEQLRHPLSLFDNKGKVAIVTGASGAFGRGCAIALGALGGKLVLASGSKGELDEVAAEVREAGGEAEAIVRRPDSLEDANAMLDTALKRFGRVDQLVVASGMNKPGFIQDLAYEDWQAVMDANVRGIWFMAKAVGAHWIANKQRGKVLVMSSVRGRHGNYSGYTGYCTSKGATDGLTGVLGRSTASPSTPSRRPSSGPSSPPGCTATMNSASRRGRARCRAFRSAGSARSRT